MTDPSTVQQRTEPERASLLVALRRVLTPVFLGAQVLGAVAFGILILFSIVVVFPSKLMTPLRLYVTGSETPSVILSCARTMLMSRNGPNGFTYTVRTAARPSEELSIYECDTEKDVGRPVTVLYSERAAQGVVLRASPNLWNVTLAVHSGGMALVGILLTFAALSASFVRAIGLTVFTVSHAAHLLREAKATPQSGLALLLSRTATVSGVLVLTLLYVAITVTVAAVLKGLLYLPTPNVVWFGLLSFGLLVFIWSPLPQLYMKYAWKFYRSHGYAIIVNVLAAVALVTGIRNVLLAYWTADPTDLTTPWEIAKAVVKALFGQ